jgi:hypothetical protein
MKAGESHVSLVVMQRQQQQQQLLLLLPLPLLRTSYLRACPWVLSPG